MRPTSCEADRHLVHLLGCLGRWDLRLFYVDFGCGFWIICSCICSIGWSIHLLLQALIPDPSKHSAHDDGSFALSKFSLEHSLIWQDHLILLHRQSPTVKPTMVSIQAPAVTCKTHLYKPPDQGCGCAGTVAAQLFKCCNDFHSSPVTITYNPDTILICWIDSPYILLSPFLSFRARGTYPSGSSVRLAVGAPFFEASASVSCRMKRQWIQTNRMCWLQ